MPGTKPLTGPQANALRALADLEDDPHRLTTPRNVAKALWPDSPGWTKVSRRYGSNQAGALGATMPMKAAALLWRLQERGCAWYEYEGNRWTITALGRRVLAGTDVPRPLPQAPKAEPLVRAPKVPR